MRTNDETDVQDFTETYNAMRADFEEAKDNGNIIKAREIIVNFQENFGHFATKEAKRWEQELKESQIA